MILPKKHIKLSESCLGMGAVILEVLQDNQTVDKCWDILKQKYIKKNKLSPKHSFDSYILTLDFLYIMGLVILNEEGELKKCN